MKAVMLDWATMGPDLDITELQTLLPDLEIYDESTDEEIARVMPGDEAPPRALDRHHVLDSVAAKLDGMLEVVEATMERAIRAVSVEEGADPRPARLVAFGGAAHPDPKCPLVADTGLRF